jgi:hypothetical protein
MSCWNTLSYSRKISEMQAEEQAKRVSDFNSRDSSVRWFFIINPIYGTEQGLHKFLALILN